MMSNWKTNRTEFYESAVSMGFYGNQDSGLIGKKDNVRKYWEDVYFKMVLRTCLEPILKEKNKISILDLGCGSGEGFELITHIPPENPKQSVKRNYVLLQENIKSYLGVDLSPSMIAQGKKNYFGKKNVRFENGNLEDGLTPGTLKHEPFDLYFSSYCSLSHLYPNYLESLFKQIFLHAGKGSVIIFDVYGKYSPEWPKLWNEDKDMLPYTMAYLTPDKIKNKKSIEWFNVCYWTVEKLKDILESASKRANVPFKIKYILDRSIFVGRHMDTGLLSVKPLSIRYQINRLLDHAYRGDTKKLEIDLEYIKEFNNNKAAWSRLNDFANRWNKIIYFLEALLNHQDLKIKNFIESEAIEELEDDLKLLAWLFRNSDRFPVADFWASIIGPQVAIILRNIEMSYSEGVGCGHGLMLCLTVE